LDKVTYKIDDLAYFRALLSNEPELTQEDIDAILDAAEPFKAVYVLYGKMGHIAQYAFLYDETGEKLRRELLNGYQKGVVLCDCNRHFEGAPMEGGDAPTGVVDIIYEEVDDIA